MKEMMDFLYYQSPLQYQMQLDGQEDPMDDELIDKRVGLRSFLNTCSIEEYCKALLTFFITKYPKESGLMGLVVGFQDNGVFAAYDRPYRSAEVSRIDFEYAKVRMKGRFIPGEIRRLKYLHELRITLKTALAELPIWVAEALQEKVFIRTQTGNKTTFTVTASPILRVELESTRFSIFINKAYFIEYLFQGYNYENEDE